MSHDASSEYATGNRWVRHALTMVDGALSAILAPPAAVPIAPPRRILIANMGHLGDVILATAVLPVLRRAWPDCRIGMLVGSWCRMIVANHALVDDLHFFDHFRLNRTKLSLPEKFARHDSTRRRALREITNARYDVAIDLRHYFANAIPLLWQANIPVRIAFTSGGFGPLLTHPMAWRAEPRHVVEYFGQLLRYLPIADEHFASLQPRLEYRTETVAHATPSSLGRPYLVMHMGTGAECKEWPIERWRTLSERLASEGQTLVFTGGGEREERLCVAVSAGLPRAVNRCGRLTWRELTAVMRGARLVVAVDSMAGHLAAAVGTPSVILSNGINHPAHWPPRHPQTRVLIHPTACAPCHRATGCVTMDCVRGIGENDVLRAIHAILETSMAMGGDSLRRTAG